MLSDTEYNALLRSKDKEQVQAAHTALKAEIAEEERKPNADCREIRAAKQQKLHLKLHLHRLGGKTVAEIKAAKDAMEARRQKETALAAVA